MSIDTESLVIRSMSIDSDDKRTFYLGPNASRVNFASQQRRALNLVWALEEKGRIEQLDSVAVVGAGVGGLMATAALVARGCEVTLFEKNDEICAAQRETDKRIIHPTINYWPENPLYDTTDFPFLNWGYGPCRRVIRHIRYQWEKYFAGKINKKTSTEIIGRSISGSEVQLTDSVGDVHGPFSAVIFATGFGKERAVTGALNVSYWDDFDWPVLLESGKKIAISGTGDGGLIDALRAALPNFDRGNLALEIAKYIDDVPHLKRRLEMIQSAAAELTDATERQRYLWTEYKKIDYGDAITTAVIRPPSAAASTGTIPLLYSGAGPYELNSAPIHRVLIAICEQNGRIEFIKGRLATGRDGKCEVEGLDPGHGFTASDYIFIPRHGVPSCETIASIDPTAADRLNSPDFKGFVDVLQGPLYPPSHFENGMGGDVFPSVSSGSSFSDLLEFLARPLLEGMSARYVSKVVRKKEKTVIQLFLTSGSTPAEIPYPDRFFGFEVEVKIGQTSVQLHSGPPDISTELPRATEVLRPGCRIFVSGKDGAPTSAGIIGLFAKNGTNKNQLFAITAAHIFDDDYFGSVWAEINGELVIIGSRVSMEWVASVDRLNYDSFDLAFISIFSGIRCSSSPSDSDVVGFVDDPVELLERRVSRHIDGEDVAYGTVNALGDVLHAQGPSKGLLSFSDTIEISSEGGRFSNVGDSGAPVLDEFGRLLGLVVAGDFAGKSTYVTPVGRIFESGKLQLATSNVDLDSILQRIDKLGTDEAMLVLDELNKEIVRDRKLVTINELSQFKAEHRDIVEFIKNDFENSSTSLDTERTRTWLTHILKVVAQKDRSFALSISVLMGAAVVGAMVGGSAAAVALAVVVFGRSMPDVLREIAKNSDTELAKRLRDLID